MKLIQTVTVKQVLTSQNRERLSGEYVSSKQQLQKECEQLLFEMKKLERNRKYEANKVKAQFKKEISERKDKIKQLEFKLDQLDMLPDGSEIKEREVQALVDIQVGDDWDNITNGKTIIVKDGMITEIRER